MPDTPPAGAASPKRFDVVIVGAGPAGSVAAIAALRSRPDARVLLLDREPAGRDKVCGDGIAPHTVRELEALGVDAVRPEEIVPLVRLRAPSGLDAEGDAPGHVVPRALFDRRLLEAAVAAGAEFREHRVHRIRSEPDEVVVDERFSAPVLIGADGANSVVRRAIGGEPNRGKALAVAVRGYAPTPAEAPDAIQLRWDARRAGGLCYAWAFPTADGASNVGYGVASSASGGGRAELVDRMRRLLPEYDLDGVEIVGHTLPLSVARPADASGRVLLTGDAASLVNPLTGEGIYSAVLSGSLAGRAAVREPSGAGAAYSTALRRRFAGQHRQLRRLYPLLDSRRMLEGAVRACREDRRMFARLLDVGLGAATFTPGDLARIGAAGALAG